LSIGQRRWSDNPPVDARNGTVLMLSIGTTFR
jgi:hypothetical protein